MSLRTLRRNIQGITKGCNSGKEFQTRVPNRLSELISIPRPSACAPIVSKSYHCGFFCCWINSPVKQQLLLGAAALLWCLSLRASLTLVSSLFFPSTTPFSYFPIIANGKKISAYILNRSRVTQDAELLSPQAIFP